MNIHPSETPHENPNTPKSGTSSKNRQILIFGTLGMVLLSALALVVKKPVDPPEPVHAFNTLQHPMLGKKGKTIALFVDYNCPVCKEFEKKQMPGIKAKIIHPGFAHITLFQSPFIAPSSFVMSHAAICAYRQVKPEDEGKENNVFWKYNDALMARTAPEGSEVGEKELLNIAKNAGLNTKEWTDCFHDKQVMTVVDEDLKAYKMTGEKGTPSIFVDGKRVKAGGREIGIEINEQNRHSNGSSQK